MINHSITLLSILFLALTHFVLAQDCGDMPERSEVESILELVLNSQPFDSLTTFYTEEGKCQCDSIILDTLFLYGNESLSVYKDSIEVRFLSDEELKTTERSCYIGYNDFLIVDGKGRAIMAFPRNWQMLWIGFHKDGDKWVLGSNYMIDDY